MITIIIVINTIANILHNGDDNHCDRQLESKNAPC